MPVVDRTHVRISRIGTALARWVGDHDFGPGANVGVAFAERDGIAVTLRHFAAIESGNARRLREHRLRLSQYHPIMSIFSADVTYPRLEVLEPFAQNLPVQHPSPFVSVVANRPRVNVSMCRIPTQNRSKGFHIVAGPGSRIDHEAVIKIKSPNN